MDAPFWIKAWNEGKTAFHQQHYHEKLTQYFPRFQPRPGQKVLVPLCGKTKDLLWLHGLGLTVHGVELYERAVEAFFSENQLAPYQKTKDPDFIRYDYQAISIRCGDFFKLNEPNTYDFVYDRAALVALPADMRKRYAEVIQRSLKPGGKCLLIVYEYDPSKMEGPPFSVGEGEIRALYGEQCVIELMESEKPANEGDRLASTKGLEQKVYILIRL